MPPGRLHRDRSGHILLSSQYGRFFYITKSFDPSLGLEGSLAFMLLELQMNSVGTLITHLERN